MGANRKKIKQTSNKSLCERLYTSIASHYLIFTYLVFRSTCIYLFYLSWSFFWVFIRVVTPLPEVYGSSMVQFDAGAVAMNADTSWRKAPNGRSRNPSIEWISIHIVTDGVFTRHTGRKITRKTQEKNGFDAYFDR